MSGSFYFQIQLVLSDSLTIPGITGFSRRLHSNTFTEFHISAAIQSNISAVF
jgi:hypothetical protein